MARHNRHASAAAAIRPECPQVVRPTDLRIAPSSRRSTGRVRVRQPARPKLRPVRQAIPINDGGNGPGDDPIPGKALESQGVLADHGLCSSGRPCTPGGSGASHAASQKGWRALRVHRHSAARVSVTQPPAGLYPQITADQERAALDGADGGRDIRLLTGNTRRLVVQGPRRAAADDLGYQRRARGVRGDPGPLPAIEHLRKPAQALGEMPASLRVEIHGDLAALVRLPRPWPG